jgi:hypothetical protein
VSTFRVTYAPAVEPPAEEIGAGFCLHVGDWIEFLERVPDEPTKVVRVVRRSDVVTIVEVAEPTVVVHLMRDDLTTDQVDDLQRQIASLVDCPTVDGFMVRGDPDALSSPNGAGFVAFLDQAAERSGKTLYVTADVGPASRRTPIAGR